MVVISFFSKRKETSENNPPFDTGDCFLRLVGIFGFRHDCEFRYNGWREPNFASVGQVGIIGNLSGLGATFADSVGQIPQTEPPFFGADRLKRPFRIAEIGISEQFDTLVDGFGGLKMVISPIWERSVGESLGVFGIEPVRDGASFEIHPLHETEKSGSTVENRLLHGKPRELVGHAFAQMFTLRVNATVIEEQAVFVFGNSGAGNLFERLPKGMEAKSFIYDGIGFQGVAFIGKNSGFVFRNGGNDSFRYGINQSVGGLRFSRCVGKDGFRDFRQVSLAHGGRSFEHWKRIADILAHAVTKNKKCDSLQERKNEFD